jgi:hypothetical protein
MTAWGCASNVAPISTTIPTIGMKAVSIPDGMRFAALRVDIANLTMSYNLPHGQ